MRKIIYLIMIIGFLASGSTAFAKKSLFYILPKGTKVLAFVGDPHSLNVTPMRLTSYENQSILIFHRKSGPGIWSFYLRGFVHDDKIRGRVEIPLNGYFMVSKRKIINPKNK